jgi:hypothetical protein
MASNPYKELASILESKMNSKLKTTAAAISAETGTITPTGLKLDRFKYEIQDYLVAEYLTVPADYMAQTDVADLHNHKVITPKELLPLSPGDRVLAIQVNGGKDFIVVARVIPHA